MVSAQVTPQQPTQMTNQHVPQTPTSSIPNVNQNVAPTQDNVNFNRFLSDVAFPKSFVLANVRIETWDLFYLVKLFEANHPEVGTVIICIAFD